MSDAFSDLALMTAAFQQAAESGWTRVSIVEAARTAGMPLDEARHRFPDCRSVLRRFGEHLDRAALDSAPREGPVRDRLFDLLMNRFEAMKPHRAGIMALLRSLPADPMTALYLTYSTRRSMTWMLQAAGDPAHGLRGALRLKGLLAVWAWTMRAFEGDESEDLSATMAALDKALGRAHEAAVWLSGEPARAQEANAAMTGDADTIMA